MGIPYICPYNVQLDHEPDPRDVHRARLLLQPVPRASRSCARAACVIMTHPTPWEFHPVHHPSYIDFFEQVLAETTDPVEIEQRYEKRFAEDEWYRHLYRTTLRLPRRPPVLHVVLGRARHAAPRPGHHRRRRAAGGAPARLRAGVDAGRRASRWPATSSAATRRSPTCTRRRSLMADVHVTCRARPGSSADEQRAAGRPTRGRPGRRVGAAHPGEAAAGHAVVRLPVPGADACPSGVEVPREAGEGRRRLRHRVGPQAAGSRRRAPLIVEGPLRLAVQARGRPRASWASTGSTTCAHAGRRSAGPVIFAANHHSHLDTPLMITSIPEPWRHRLVVARGGRLLLRHPGHRHGCRRSRWAPSRSTASRVNRRSADLAADAASTTAGAC